MDKINNIKNKKTQKILTKQSSCAPGKGNNKTCFDQKSLSKIVSQWNNNNPDDKININGNSNNIWKQINKKMSKKCNSETCWLKQDFIKKISDDLQGYFKPKIPKSWLKEKNTWLTTTDIENVIFQYEDAVKDFKFLGVVPIDFDYEYSVGKCIVDEICRLNIHKLKKKNKQNWYYF